MPLRSFAFAPRSFAAQISATLDLVAGGEAGEGLALAHGDPAFAELGCGGNARQPGGEDGPRPLRKPQRVGRDAARGGPAAELAVQRLERLDADAELTGDPGQLDRARDLHEVELERRVRDDLEPEAGRVLRDQGRRDEERDVVARLAVEGVGVAQLPVVLAPVRWRPRRTRPSPAL